MKFLEKSDVKNHRSVSRGKSRHALRPVGYPVGGSFPKIEPRLTRKNTRSFVDDFYSEHSSLGISVAQIAISASSNFVAPAITGGPRGHDLSSPNCVYFG